MRAVVRRHRLRAGDRFVLGEPGGVEAVSDPIVAVGEHTVVLTDGSIIETPPDRAVYIERSVDDESMVAMAMAQGKQVHAD